MLRWKRGWLILTGATVLTAVGCSHGPPPQELLNARSAYQEASTSPEGRERPTDVAEAREALLDAEREYDRSKDSPRTRSLAYVAMRKAQLAQVRGEGDLAARQQSQAEQALRETQAQQQQRAQQELDAARQQLAEAERARQDALRQQAQANALAQTQQAESQRLQAEAQRRQQEAEQMRQQAQQRQAEAQRMAEESARRQQAEAEAQRLAQANAELQQRAQQLEAERQARAEAEQRANQQLEAERQARAQAEQKASQALTQLDTLADVKVQEEARGTVVTLSGSVLFASGAVDLLPSARDRLSEVADALKQSQQPILIEGHTDSQGSDAYNEQLSLGRAERVRDFLITRGVPANRIDVRGMGEYRPVARNTTPEGRANNRRVEIVVERGMAGAGTPRTGGVGGSGEQQQRQQQGTGGTGTQESPPGQDLGQPRAQPPEEGTGGGPRPTEPEGTQAPEQQGTGGAGGTAPETGTQAPEQQGTGGSGTAPETGGGDTQAPEQQGTGGSGSPEASGSEQNPSPDRTLGGDPQPEP